MSCKLIHIEKPYSGEFEEKIYDIKSHWNSGDWCWIKFDEGDKVFCGQFRGKFIGFASSEKIGIIVILTKDYMYILDIDCKDLIEYERQPSYRQIIKTPFDDILISDGYSLKVFRGKNIESIKSIELPIKVDSLEFMDFDGKILKIQCEEFYNWQNKLILLFDCETFTFMHKDRW